MRRVSCLIGAFLFLAVELFPLSLTADAQAPVNVAAIFSRTGIAANHNAPLLPLLEAAVEEVNGAGGLLGREVKLIIIDNQSTPIGSVKAAEEAVRLGVTAVIGAHWSSHSLAMAPILQEAGIPMITPGSTNPDITRVGDYIFRACFVDSFQGTAMARFARGELKASTAVVARNVDEPYSVALAEYFENSFRQMGGRVLLDIEYRGKAVDFADALESVRILAPDVFYLPGYTRDSGLLIRQAGVMGIRTTFLGGDAWDEINEFAGDAIEGSYQSAPWHPSVPSPRSVHLQEMYLRRHGVQIKNFSAPLAYDAFMLLADSIKRAGSVDREKIRDALANTCEFRGATGVISFEGGRDPKNKEVVILKWERGAPGYFKTIRPEL